MVSGRNRKMNVQRAIQAILHRQEPGEIAGDDLDFTSADQRTLSEHLKIAFLAMVVGALAGGAAILFRSVIDGVTFGAVGIQTGSILDLARSLPWWHVLLIPAVGGLVVGWFVQSVSYERRLHGVPDVIVASFLRQGRLPGRAGVGAALVSAVSAGVGASVGREGPMVHLGASVGSWIAQRLGLRPYDSRTLLACGVAAGVAASFNVPVGATIFAFELMIRRYSIQRLAPIVIAAVVGTALIRAYYGDFPAWHVPERILVSYWEFPAFALLGVICACTGFVLIRSVALVSHAMNRLAIPPMLRPALGGLGVGAIAVFFPHVLGIGYEAADEALRGALPFALLAALVLAKIAATALSLGAGFGGGIFSPSLVIGAMTGGAFGVLATAAFPEFSSGHGAYTIVGMAAVAGAVLHTPFATIIIIFEMTASYPLALGVMLAVVISAILLNDVWRSDFFNWQLKQRGVNLKEITPQAVLGDVPVATLLREDVATVSASAGLDDMTSAFAAASGPGVLVVDTDGHLVGRVTYERFRKNAVEGGTAAAEVTAERIAERDPPSIELSVDAGRAWVSMREHDTDCLPVVDSRASMRLVGQVTKEDLLTAYHRILVNTS